MSRSSSAGKTASPSKRGGGFHADAGAGGRSNGRTAGSAGSASGAKPAAGSKPAAYGKPAPGSRPAQSGKPAASASAGRTAAAGSAAPGRAAAKPEAARGAAPKSAAAGSAADKSPRPAKPTSAAERIAAKAAKGGEAPRPRRRKVDATAREVALNVLAGVDEGGAYSNLLLNRSLQQAELSPADAGLATELVYGTIARQATLDYFLNHFIKSGVKRLNPWVRALLRMSLYQIRYLDRIPPHAAVNEAVEIAKKRGHQGIASMINGVLRSILREEDQLILPQDLPTAERIALEHSHPQWLVERWIAQYGEDTAEAICAANNQPPKVSIRVNTLRVGRDELLRELEAEGREVRVSELASQGIVVESGGNMANDGLYRDGRYSIQDESSMLVAEALDPQPGMSVLDCCAAPGGKTAHIAEKMGDKGRIVANDLHEHKQKLIQEQTERLGLTSVESSIGDALALKDHYPPASFDRVLLDAPCSGFGVIRRKPDLRWAKTPEDTAAIARLQRQMLNSVSGLVKPGGILVYSTCTIEREENQRAVAEFLRDHAEFVAEPFEVDALASLPQSGGAGVQILPNQFGSDGFYIARLRRRS
ncbi:16S rRNA (cytosine(967)-C(5))-methyltransferase [Saccharibacillus sp. O16]|nr:16S rRNA (cytosine(967)-C(5))-methyltransferase [Saccharibacillus sp. O16]